MALFGRADVALGAVFTGVISYIFECNLFAPPGVNIWSFSLNDKDVDVLHISLECF